MNAKDKVSMDYAGVEEMIHKTAQEWLNTINGDTLNGFVEATKNRVKSVLQKYYLETDDLYSEGDLKIQDSDQLDKFMDFHDGYRAKMKEWVSGHKVTTEQLNIPDPEQFRKGHINYKQPIAIAGIGTIVFVGLAVVTSRLLFLAGEALVLGASAYRYKRSKDTVEKEYEQKKAEFVTMVISNLKNWLAQAESYSNSLLESFGLVTYSGALKD